MSRIVLYLTNEDKQSGGMRAVYYLHYLLLRCGYAVALNEPCHLEDVGVYTDNQPGNAWDAQRVVRYMCFFAREYFKGGRIPSSECVIVYHQNYVDEIQQHCDSPIPPGNIVRMPSIEAGLFYPEEKKVEAIAYVGKNTARIRDGWEGMAVIGKANMPRQEFAALLRRSRNVFSFDHHTIVTSEAALAGCQPWYVYTRDNLVKAPTADAESYLMRPEQDEVLAHRFVQIIRDFFSDQGIARKDD